MSWHEDEWKLRYCIPYYWCLIQSTFGIRLFGWLVSPILHLQCCVLFLWWIWSLHLLYGGVFCMAHAFSVLVTLRFWSLVVFRSFILIVWRLVQGLFVCLEVKVASTLFMFQIRFAEEYILIWLLVFCILCNINSSHKMGLNIIVSISRGAMARFGSGCWCCARG